MRSWKARWRWRTTSPSLSLTPITDGNRTFAEWQADFDCAPERETALVQQIGNGVFQAGLNALKQRFRR